MEFFGMSRQGRMVATIFQAEMLPFFLTLDCIDNADRHRHRQKRTQ